MIGQTIVFVTLVLALVLFVWGRWRYDVVALLALLAVTVSGIVRPEDAFLGFGHAAVVTVAAVLVASKGLKNAGLIDVIAGRVGSLGNHPVLQLATLTVMVAAVSGFMNNIGALAILMPVAVQIAREGNRSPGMYLMPLAAGSLLGGLVTVIGTPPNIIIATYRKDVTGEAFRMFDFAPVGLGLTAAGVAFIALVGWRLIPKRSSSTSPDALFEIEAYTTELRVPPGSRLVGQTLQELETLTDADVVVVGLVRDNEKTLVPANLTQLRADDHLIVEAGSQDLRDFIGATGVQLAGDKEIAGRDLGSAHVLLQEAVVTGDSPVIDSTVRDLDLRRRYGMNLLAVARRGERVRNRLRGIRFQPGDVLLLQGTRTAIRDALAAFRFLPLAERNLEFGRPSRIVLALGIFGIAIGLASTGALQVQVAFTAAAVAMVVVGLLSLREAYESIDWPIIVLLGAMIPIGDALERTGGARRVADQILAVSLDLPVPATLALFMLVTMGLSNVVNNAAAAVLMAPIALSLAAGLGASADPFLMAVAVGASSAFLTPIGHQSNTLVMGPGGYRFGDYWQMGLPLSLLVVLLGVPLILRVWPA
ncbi:MAG TPA: SLC13 family permease [Gemmatimonadota bacterium]|nr:SLC13 family permease [Gemmatimonadota bacterium]